MLELQPIGTIHTPFKKREGMPIQPAGARGVRGTVEIEPGFAPGLKDLDGFSHVILLFHFHRSEGYRLVTKPFMDDVPRGVFATRAPRRPNPIGLSVVRLVGVKDNVMEIEDVDMLDGTPLLDIKPYVPEFETPQEFRLGWLEKARGRVRKHRSDNRFKDQSRVTDPPEERPTGIDPDIEEER